MIYCNDYGDNPCCLKEVDERYTMKFDDIGEPPVYWCAHCGPIAHAMEAKLDKAIQNFGLAYVVEVIIKEAATIIRH